MKRLPILLLSILLALPVAAGAWSLQCDPPAAGTQAPTFYYLTGMPTGTVATYTTALPNWFATVPGGVAAIPDSTKATGFKLTFPFTGSGVPTLSGTMVACDGVGCSAVVPFGAPGAPGNAQIANP